MEQTEQYTIWIKPLRDVTVVNDTIKSLVELDGIISASSTNIDAPGITKKEAVLAVALSVTANFATDGIKAIISHLQEDEVSKVVLCRRPDGSNLSIGDHTADS